MLYETFHKAVTKDTNPTLIFGHPMLQLYGVFAPNKIMINDDDVNNECHIETLMMMMPIIMTKMLMPS